MHLWRLLLPILSIGYVAAQSCNGIRKGDVCCAAGCKTCGGTGCSSRNGLTAADCCTSTITAAAKPCGSAPCLLTGGSPSPSPPTPTPTPSGVCNGVQKDEYCCPAGCGTCGGSGCGSRGPGLGVEDCCTSRIRDSGVICGKAPCILSGGSPTPTPPTPSPPSPSPPSSSPTPVMTIPTSCSSSTARPTFRYAATTGNGGRLYAEGKGCFTMTDLYKWRGTVSSGGVTSPKGPIYMLDSSHNKLTTDSAVTKKWLLEAELFITGGAIFYCKGSKAGGDCDELRIESTGSMFHEVRGHGGSMYFESTIVTSWDTPNKKPQSKYSGGRSFLNCVSEKLTGEKCEGAAKNNMGECRMDMINSEIGYLGYFDSESYGITWKVRGYCKDGSNGDVFDKTNVYGDIKGCDIHHNYYGHYTYGHQGGVWTNNKMHDNWQYGFDPHDDSDYLTIANNEVYNNVNHGIIASKRCNNAKIYNNVIRDGGAQAAGIFLHRSSDYAEVYGNKITNMQDAGIAMLEAFNAKIHDNQIDGAKYGIRLSLGSASNKIYDNSFKGITSDGQGLYTYKGSDAPDVSNGRPSKNSFEDNEIVCDGALGVKINQGDGNSFLGNKFIKCGRFEFPDSTSTTWKGNDVGGGCVEGSPKFTSGSDSIPKC